MQSLDETLRFRFIGGGHQAMTRSARLLAVFVVNTDDTNLTTSVMN